MKLMLNYSSVVAAAAAGLATLAFTHTASAQGSSTAPTCDEVLATLPENVRGNAIYGIGGSASTPTIGYIAAALQDAPPADRLIVFYDGSLSACPGYQHWRTLPGTPPDGTPITDARWSRFRYWIETTDSPLLGHNWGTPEAPIYECNAPRNRVTFSYMGTTPQLCPGEVPVPAGAAKFIGPVQTVSLITNRHSQQESISAEALYLIYGFGAGTYDIAPWNEPDAVLRSQVGNLQSILLGVAIGVPAGGFVGTVPDGGAALIDVVGSWPNPNLEQVLGYVSGAQARIGEYGVAGDFNAEPPIPPTPPKTKTLAYQHYGQHAAYLPDTDRSTPDRANVRSGQYALWTPSWFYSHVGSDGEPENPNVAKLVRWIDGTRKAPAGVPIQESVVAAGNEPLCAQRAIRPEGDFSAVQSYAPPNPCNGWFEAFVLGEDTHQPCSVTSQCDGAAEGEQCRYGYCEAY